MAIADSSRSSLAYVQEPSGLPLAGTETFRLLRNTGSNLNGAITSSPNDEIRSDGQISGSSHTSAANSGDVNIQLSFAEYDDFLAATLESADWTTLSINVTAFNAGTKVLTVSSTSGIQLEQVIKVAAATQAANNQLVTVKSIGSGVITVYESVVTETGSSATGTSSIISNGITERRFAIEANYADVGEFFLSEGLRAGTIKFTLGNSQINGSISFMGTNYTPSGSTASAASYLAATSNDVLNGASGIGSVSIRRVDPVTGLDADSPAIFESLEVSMGKDSRERPGLGSLYPIGIGRGRFSADLTANIYFESRAMLANFKANDVMNVRFSLTDDESNIYNGNSYHFSYPGCRIMSYTADPESADADIMAKVTFKAVLDPYITNKTCIISRIS